MPPPSRPPTTPWQFCLSCCLTLGSWVLWLALGFLLAVQTYVAVSKDVPVPDFLLRRIENEFAQANLEVRFGRAHFDPSGQVLLENVVLRARSFDEPLAMVRYVYLRKSFWSMLAGQTVPDEIKIEGATLQLPAIFSPSGTTESLLSDAAATLRYVDDTWQFDQLNFRMGNLPVTARGEFIPRKRTGEPTLSLDEVIARFRQLGRQIALRLPLLQSCEQPVLDLQFHSSAAGGVHVTFATGANAVRRPAGLPVEITSLTASGTWVWDQVRPRNLHVTATAGSVGQFDTFVATNVRGEFALFPGSEAFAFDRVQGSVVATEVQALDEVISLPALSGAYTWPTGAVRAELAVRLHGATMDLNGTANLKEKSASVHLAGPVPPDLVTGLLTRYGPKLEPYFRFGDPVELQAQARFDPGWKFAGLWTRVHGGRLDSRGVLVTSTRGRIDVDPDWNFLAYDAHVVCGENFARGSYWMNFRTMDYRMLLTGRLRPPAISGWFRGDWWPDFWSNFAFPTEPPQADADVQGCWRNADNTSYFGSTDAVNPTVLGATFEKAHTRVFVRPNFDHALELEVERAGGKQRASGWFKRFADNEAHKTSALEYDLTANLDADSYRHLGSATAEKLLAPWRFTAMPDLQFRGRTDYRDDAGITKLVFTGHTNEPVWFHDFPIDGVAVSGALNGNDLTLEKIDCPFAGGTLQANASLIGTPAVLGFDASLKGADFARVILALEAFEAAHATTPTAKTDSKVMKRASGERLDVSLSAQGSPDDITRMRGNGNMQLTGAELGEIHLFGLLSQVLSAVWLNFSSLKLDAARSSFQMRDGRVHFPNLKVTGPSAVIDAQGDYTFDTKSLDFSARLKPYEETHNPITAAIGVIVNPLTRIFELRLTGPLAKPDWSVNIGGSSPHSSPSPQDAPAPAPVPPAPSGAADKKQP